MATPEATIFVDFSGIGRVTPKVVSTSVHAQVRNEYPRHSDAQLLLDFSPSYYTQSVAIACRTIMTITDFSLKERTALVDTSVD